MQHQEIFAPEPQSAFDLGQPSQNGIDFPLSLAERYQPRKLEDFVGLERPKQLLANLCRKPRACALLFIGPPGAGKTAMALAFAEQLPGSLHHVSAQKCDVATLDALNEKFAYGPPRGNFWVCLIDEADQMTEKAQLQLLSRLDGTAALKPTFGGGFERGTPPPIIWIFTCNGRGTEETEAPHSFAARFLSRNMLVPFPAVSQSDLASYLERIWTLEGGEKCQPEYFNYMAEGVGVRDALMRLDSDLLAGPRQIPLPKPAEPVKPAVTAVVLAVGQSDRDRYSAAARKAWETRRARMHSSAKHHR
jgi:hypothetical protein